MEIILKPVAIVKNVRTEREDDNWGEINSEITLIPEIPAEALTGLKEFSHIEVIFYFDKISEADTKTYSRIPRGMHGLPEVGIFTQRASKRPNKLGVTICKLTDIKDKTIFVKGLDAIDGTPVLDIKPALKEFLPDRNEVTQPDWVNEIMKNYW
ncbi:MAG TPA: tRNA (N6-threonylcarbamoyladenosine(37)-N6)-methyltransferase TrmO [Ignavibacteria bacterium]|nr:tRNA (N6-threonylcarbamoyladenosine(37)-N6)-methyltransferase TrmO [Ignavibacteria bacterium]